MCQPLMELYNKPKRISLVSLISIIIVDCITPNFELVVFYFIILFYYLEDEKKIENLSLLLSAAKEKLNVDKRAFLDKKKQLDAENEKLVSVNCFQYEDILNGVMIS